jgi:hypothetical protein
MPEPPSDWLSASAVGEYAYCARAYGLRRLTDGAPDLAAAARQAQGLPPTWRPGVDALVGRRRRARAGRLAAGTRAHRRHAAGLESARLLTGLGLLLVLVAAGLLLAPLLTQ